MSENTEDDERRLNPELMMCLRAMTRFVYVVTDEEHRLLRKLSETLTKYQANVHIFNPTMGLMPLASLMQDWTARQHPVNEANIHEALVSIYKMEAKGRNFFIIQDPERFLSDVHVQRRIMNIADQLQSDDRNIKILIFVSNRLSIPKKLQRYFEVVKDGTMTDKEIHHELTAIAGKLEIPVPPPEMSKHFRGLTQFEMTTAVAQSIVRTKKDPNNPKRIDPKIIGDYKRRQLNKTDLLQYVDTSNFSFEQVGGAANFKKWASETKAAWTEEGQRFGLVPPKGVLAVGVWGCGKSLSVKAMGSAWRLPVVQLETGKLRSSGVGESEANVYQAMSLIESVQPCIVWIDEAEKSLAGSASSAQSDAGTTSRMIGILSTWLQETNAKVCLAMTANSVRGLPVEFVNRMDERFFFDLPSEEERIEILKIHLAKKRQNPQNFQLAELGDAAVNMVGREIEQAIGAAMTSSFHANKNGLDHDILLKELKTKPRIFKTMADEMKDIVDWVGYDEGANDGIRARYASKYRSNAVKSRFAAAK